MTQEQIEKEIKKRLDTPDNQWDSIFNSGFSRGFSQGAKWRIASVWHGPEEKPTPGKIAVVEYLTGDIEHKYRIDVFCGFEWKEMCHYDRLIRFAYIDDLLPEEE